MQRAVLTATAAPRSPWRGLILPGLATLCGLAVLVGLGIWQLERKVSKEHLIAAIEARAFGEPASLPPEAEWPRWTAEAGEYRRVRLAGSFLHGDEAAVHGLMSGQPGRPLQGYYLLTPLRLRDGSIVIVNRGFVPSELRDPARRPGFEPEGEVAITGLMRSPEKRGWFMPENNPAKDEWFVRDIGEIARAKGLDRVAPFLVDADAAPNPGGWPKGGQTRLAIPNDHLQYALTWFGLVLTLAGVFAGFAWRRLHPAPA